MVRISATIQGMTCPTCEKSIDRALSLLPWVSEVQADFRTGSVLVDSDSTPDMPALVAAIQAAGYDIVELSGEERRG
jgi:copper chaperone CopZ